MNGPKIRVLVVDDEETIRDSLEMTLEHEGYEVALAADGQEGLERFRSFEPGVVVLDWMLPDVDGVTVCRQLRAASHVPILMLTARDHLDDRVLGLDSGADDYLTKPFRLKELLARLRALLRRAGSSGTLLRFDDVELDRTTRTVRRQGRRIDLTTREFELLELLMQRPRHVLAKEQILNLLWGWDFEGATNVVEVHVSALRAKLMDTERQLIRTVRGVGYALGR